MEISLHNEEEDVGPKGIWPEKKRNPILKKDVEDDPASNEQSEREDNVRGEKAESTDKNCLPISLPLDELVG